MEWVGWIRTGAGCDWDATENIRSTTKQGPRKLCMYACMQVCMYVCIYVGMYVERVLEQDWEVQVRILLPD